MKKWEPKEGQTYYYVSDCGSVQHSQDFCRDEDDERIEFGNCFKTEKQAKAVLTKIKALLKEGK